MDNKPEKRRVRQIVWTALFFLFLWCHDLSVTCLMNNLVLYNGWNYASPSLMYHLSLYGIIITFMITILDK
jgi:hypothetical protein